MTRKYQRLLGSLLFGDFPHCIYTYTMKKKLYIALSICILAGVLTYIEISNDAKNKQDQKIVTGTIVQGIDLGLDYCLNGYFLLDDNEEYVLLRSDNQDAYMPYVNEEDLGTEVTLSLEYPPENTSYCEALICECEAWAIVKE